MSAENNETLHPQSLLSPEPHEVQTFGSKLHRVCLFRVDSQSHRYKATRTFWTVFTHQSEEFVSLYSPIESEQEVTKPVLENSNSSQSFVIGTPPIQQPV